MSAHTATTASPWSWHLLRRALRLVTQPPSQVVLAGLGCMAAAASKTVWNQAASWHLPGGVAALLVCGELVLAIICFVASAGDHISAELKRVLRIVAVPVMLWAALMATQAVPYLAHSLTDSISAWPPHYSSDDLYYNHYNALLVLKGVNPYAGADLAGAFHYFHVAPYTPVTRGRFQGLQGNPSGSAWSAPIREYLAHPQDPPPEVDPDTLHSYPAGAFLIDTPMVWAGMRSVTTAQIVLFVVVWLALVASAPPAARLLVGLLLLSSLDVFHQVGIGDFDMWPALLVCGAWLVRQRRLSSALLLGAACAIKQTAWIAVPFYLLWTWRTGGTRAAARRGGVILATFVAINLPWIVASPRSWFASIWLPMTLPLIPGGSGLIDLALHGVVPLWPAGVYTLLEVVTLGAALGWYWRAYRDYPLAGILLAYVPLLVAWRSPGRYFGLLPLAAIAIVVVIVRQQREADSRADKHPASEAAPLPEAA